MVSFVFHFMTRLNYDFREYKFIAFVVNKLSKLACKIETQNDLKKNPDNNSSRITIVKHDIMNVIFTRINILTHCFFVSRGYSWSYTII